MAENQTPKNMSDPEERCERCKKPLSKNRRYTFCKPCFESLSSETQAQIKKTYWIKKIFFLFSYILIVTPFFLLFRSTEIQNLIVFFVLLVSGIALILILEKKYPQYVPDEEA